jgi:hypothetical protein
MHLAEAFFVTRAKTNMNARRIYSAPADCDWLTFEVIFMSTSAVKVDDFRIFFVASAEVLRLGSGGYGYALSFVKVLQKSIRQT